MLPLKWAKLGSVTALSVPRPTSAHICGDVVPILGISKFPKPGVLPWSDDAGTQSNFSQNDDQRTMKFLAPYVHRQKSAVFNKKMLKVFGILSLGRFEKRRRWGLRGPRALTNVSPTSRDGLLSKMLFFRGKSRKTIKILGLHIIYLYLYLYLYIIIYIYMYVYIYVCVWVSEWV